MHASIITAVAALVVSAAAKNCINQTVPVTISARQATFDIHVPVTDLEATDFILNITQQGRNFTGIAQVGAHTTAGTYNVSTQFCFPSTNSSSTPVVQVLTHGIGFDKTYWDFNYANYNYSYVDYALNNSYYTLAFDRLGIGNSSHGEPLNEIQQYLEVQATIALTKQLRAGTFPRVSTRFTKVVHVGHSFGSAQTYSLANLSPNITDAIVLTGFSMNASFIGLFAAGGNFQQAFNNQPLRFGSANGSVIQDTFVKYAPGLADFLAPIDLSSLPPPQTYVPGYIISSDVEAQKYLFFKPGFYDPKVLAQTEATKQPVTEGEILTLGSLAAKNAYTGPVLVITGDADLPYCGIDCLATGGAAASIPAGVKANFPSAKSFQAYIQPNTGHGLNLHYNATGSYKVITNFLKAQGL